MRTTVTLDDDVAAAVGRIRREKGLGVSDALNQLARAGLMVKRGRQEFTQRTANLALSIDVTNVAEALEQLDGPTGR
jgi:hypothetical protein